MTDISSMTSGESIPEVGTATNEARGVSILRRAAQERNKRRTHLFLDIPSWNGALIGEYQVIDGEELKDMAVRAQNRIRNGADPVKNDIDLIVRALVGFWAKDPDTGERVEVEDDFGQVDFSRIAELLGVADEIKDTDMTVRYLMGERDDSSGGWKQNTVAISTHSRDISRWMRDPSKNDDLEKILGNF